MSNALILHGWQEGPESNWYGWLKYELIQKGYDATNPELPTMMSPLPEIKGMFDLIQSQINSETVIIGHSLSAILGLKLAETNKFKKLILVAGWDYNDLTAEHRLFWDRPINHKAIKENVDEIYVVHSNDPYIAPFQAEQMAKRLDAEYIFVPDKGHFLGEAGVIEVPEVLNLL